MFDLDGTSGVAIVSGSHGTNDIGAGDDTSGYDNAARGLVIAPAGDPILAFTSVHGLVLTVEHPSGVSTSTESTHDHEGSTPFDQRLRGATNSGYGAAAFEAREHFTAATFHFIKVASRNKLRIESK